MRNLKFSPVITPFVNNKIDLEKLRSHVNNLFSKGIDGLFLCGSTSLCPSLSIQERKTLISSLNDIPERIIFQVGSLNLEDTLELATIGKRAGVRAIAAYPPYYYINIPQYFLEKYYIRISSIYPTFVYNFPQATGYDINSSLVKKINNSGGNIVGIKDTINDPAHMLSFKQEFGDSFTVFSGPDFLVMNAARIGIDGVVTSSTNYVPELITAIFNSNNLDEMMKLQAKITGLVNISRRFGQLSANYVLVKALQGYDVGSPREPIFPLSEDQQKELTEEALKIIHT
ncbi:MAG: dihydrodipicolinate synthase family protein [Thermoplasmataceae archaeon]|jgi:2-dehydro-3-deoxy-phosphogluconate/2-dehydro-3-deoxy-6-phosphogalactonate aldolase